MKEDLQVKRWICEILPSAEETGLVLLTGARQTGKTTTARDRYADMAYYNLDAIEFREQLSGVSTFHWGRDVGPAVLDEIQKVPELLDKVKYAYDEGRIRRSVLLGSAQILLMKKIRETLAGRVFVYELFPLMFSELVAGNHGDLSPTLLERLLECEDIDSLLSSLPERLPANQGVNLKDKETYLLRWGGMPGILPLQDTRRSQWLKSYESTYLERDLGDLARLDDLKPFRRFQRLTALRSGNLLSFSELARDTGIAVETARRYLEYLRLSYQAFLLPPFSENLTSQVVKTPKVYWIDCGLMRSLTGRTAEAPVDGHEFETYLASEILKLTRTKQLDAELFYYRTRSGMEVDFLLQSPRGVLVLESKNRNTVKTGDTGSMKRLMENLGKRCQGGVLAYRGDVLHRLDKGCWAVPTTRLLAPEGRSDGE